MVVIVMVVALVGTLGAIAMTNGNHASISSGRGRSWEQALHVAEAGADVAIARVQQANGSYTSPLTITGATSEGSYTVTVTAQQRNRHLVTSLGTAPGPAGLGAKRRVQFLLAPPPAFRAALLSNTSIDTKNNDHVKGDVWANENVFVDAHDVIEGSITAATGWISMGHDARVTGAAQSGGYHPTTNDGIRLEQNAVIEGNATASVTAPVETGACGGEPQNRYTIRLQNGTHVHGDAKTWGSVASSGTVHGQTSQFVCTAAPPTIPIPIFVYNASNYDPSTLHVWGTPTSPSATASADASLWIEANRTNLKGTLVVFQSGGQTQSNRLDLSGGVLREDFTLITNLPIYSASASDSIPDHDAIVVLASFYQPEAGTQCDVNHDASDCAIHLKNHAQTSSDVAWLSYAPNGPVAIKNNSNAYGAVYAQNIQIKNNQTLTYDPRIERIVGFGPVTLEPSQWRELPPL